VNADYLRDNLWMPVLVGVILLIVAASFSKTVREKFWAPIGRRFRWMIQLRVTTAERMTKAAADLAEANELAGQYASQAHNAQEVARAEVASAHDAARAEIEAVRSLALHEAAVAKQEQEEVTRANLKDVYQQGYQKALAEVAARRSVPRATPAWRIDGGADQTYLLRNTQTDALVSDVKLETNPQAFAFTGPKQWQGPFVGEIEFEGHRLDVGRKLGVKFEVRYHDELGDPQVGFAWLDKEPMKMWVL
jgi:hypothetical protein